MFSKTLDIISFFIIMILNLSLISLICYYFKKKFEAIEEVQQEQSKILYDLVNKDNKDIDPLFMSMSMSNKPTSITDIMNEPINKSYELITEDNDDEDIKKIQTDKDLFNVDVSISEDKQVFNFDKLDEDDDDEDEEDEDEEDDDEEDDEDEEDDDEEEEDEEDDEDENEDNNELKEELPIETSNIFTSDYEGDDEVSLSDIKEIKDFGSSSIDLEKKTVGELQELIRNKLNNESTEPPISLSQIKKMKKKELIEFITNNIF